MAGSNGAPNDFARTTDVSAISGGIIVSEIDQVIEQIDQGASAWNETDVVVETDVSRPLDAVVPVRLTAETYSDLRREARELGVRPSTLIRMWILEKLRSISSDRRTA
jgi:hypothetical protein